MRLQEHIALSRTPPLPSRAAGARSAPPLLLVRTIRTQISVLRLVSVYLVALTLASGSVIRTWTTSVQPPAHLLPATMTIFTSNPRSTSTSRATGALAFTTSTDRIPAHLLYSVFTIISSEFAPRGTHTHSSGLKAHRSLRSRLSRQSQGQRHARWLCQASFHHAGPDQSSRQL